MRGAEPCKASVSLIKTVQIILENFGVEVPPNHLQMTSESPPNHLGALVMAAQKHLGCTSKAPRMHLKSTSDAPRMQLKSTSDAPSHQGTILLGSFAVQKCGSCKGDHQFVGRPRCL